MRSSSVPISSGRQRADGIGNRGLEPRDDGALPIAPEEVAHQELGMKIIDRLQIDTADQAMVEQQAKKEGRQIVMVLAPKKK